MENNQGKLIKGAMESIISTQVNLLELQEQILSYVEYKHIENGFPFGELLILHYNILNGKKTEEIYTVAAGIELLILSSDILDDIQDSDSPNKPWAIEPGQALNSATALLFLCANTIKESHFQNKYEALSIVLKYTTDSIFGQHKDILNLSKNESDYIEMTLEKSGSLTALACLVGAVLANKNYPKEIEGYAKLIGLIGQFNNDLSDILTLDNNNDLMNKKYTLPIIYLMNANHDEFQDIRDYYNKKISMDDFRKKQESIKQKMIETGVVEYIEVMKKLFRNTAIEKMKNISIHPIYRQQLLKYLK